MSFDVTIYCPDSHIFYDASLLDKKGVGGGVVARIRLAEALTRQGNQVTMVAHVTRERCYRGVTYIPLKLASKKRKTDVLIMISSGGGLSLEPALNLSIKAKWREIWVQGIPFIKGIEKLRWDAIIPCSNFIYKIIRDEWPLISPNLFTVYNGAPLLKQNWRSVFFKRNRFRLIYTSHPSKGLRAALGVLSKLRVLDERYHLHVYGGDGLWGGTDAKMESQRGVTYLGTQSQAVVLSALQQAFVSLHLQARLEPFGMVLTESMLHGAIPVASYVGAYPELVSHGKNGFLLSGNHLSDDVQSMAAEWIHALHQNPDYAAFVHRNAMNIPWDWDTMAKVRVGYWEWVINKKGILSPDIQRCEHCNGQLLLLADGFHCTDCGWYYSQFEFEKIKNVGMF